MASINLFFLIRKESQSQYLSVSSTRSSRRDVRTKHRGRLEPIVIFLFIYLFILFYVAFEESRSQGFVCGSN